jgi:ABC-2 type transport system permease protein
MTGFYAVLKKELQDNFAGWLFIILFALVLMAGIYAIFTAAQTIRSVVTGTSPFIFMALFTASGDVLPSFIGMIAIILPVVGIALGMDAINSERNGGTLSRLISQPIYRDTIINAKFAAGVLTIGVIMTTIILLVSGLGIRMIGIVPTAEEAWRLFFFLIISVIYGSFWLGLSILFSVLFRRVAISALAAVAIWLFFFQFFSKVVGALANFFAPIGDTVTSQINNVQFLITAIRFSPIQVFQEAVAVILSPGQRTMSELLQILTGSPNNTPLSTPLSLNQSLSAVWPHIITLFVLTVICFAISYIRFMRQEVRAT